MHRGRLGDTFLDLPRVPCGAGVDIGVVEPTGFDPYQCLTRSGRRPGYIFPVFEFIEATVAGKHYRSHANRRIP